MVEENHLFFYLFYGLVAISDLLVLNQMIPY